MISLLHISVERVEVLENFPSGSAMEFFNDQIYLMGDDARHILIMDKEYKPVFNITMFPGTEKRIEKKVKADIEASAVITYKNNRHLLILGSASKSQRERAFLFTLPAHNESAYETFDTDDFTDRLKDMAVAEVNIEGAAAVGNQLIMSNRGNKTNPDNLLFVTDSDFFDHQDKAPIHIIKVMLPQHDFPIGISSLSYIPTNDILFFTASIELTVNAYDDGGIGDSYIGYIKNISAKLLHESITPDVLINLPETNAVFKGQKIESLCFEKVEGNLLTAHLVSDNDLGESTLFKVRLQIA
jgi:hypothetical protein